jgi:multiple sugar transport system permease protein
MGVTLLMPALVVIAATTLYPLSSALVTSFRRWQLTRSMTPGPFIGFENYARIFDDRGFHNSIIVTLNFTVLSVVLSIVIGLAMALLLYRAGKVNTLIKSLLIFPFAMAPILKGYSWRFMLNAEYGIYDYMIDRLIPPLADIVWLGHRHWALVMLAMSEVWGWAGIIALMFIGAMGAISPEIYDAAKVDGATPSRIFWHITLPLLRPVLLVVTLLKTIFSLKMFDQVVAMTGGGPGNATQTLNYYVYHTAFRALDMGYASALAYVLVLTMGLFAFVYVRILLKREV